MNPLDLFVAERAVAREHGDAMAALCTAASVDEAGLPQVRTLVLRDVDGALALFVNRTSPKWRFLQEHFAILTYWPTTSIQYRLSGRCKILDPDLIRESWLLRPDPPKRMDWLYQQVQSQSSSIEGRDALLKALETLNLPDPLIAPENATGVKLLPETIERLDLNQANGVHDRTRYEIGDDGWHKTTLVP